MRLLCLSNGHGEDLVAVRILHQLRQRVPRAEIAVLPIVGEGQAYREFQIIGPVQSLPSGGFLYMDGRQLAKDVQGGLVKLTWRQLQTVKVWAKSGGLVLAVGDIVPLAFAWWSGIPYAFVGTARSEYYLRDQTGPLRRQYWWQQWESWSGCVYQPWERWLMKRPRCRGIFPRDRLTTEVLNRLGIAAIDAGNPMMDDLPTSPYPHTLTPDTLRVMLLPGSRAPEAFANWERILQSLKGVIPAFPERTVQFFAAIAPTLNLDALYQSLVQNGWEALPASRSQDWRQPGTTATLQLSRTAFQSYLLRADCAIAMAGTATEQFVGLGKPAIAIPGDGPQFTFRFAEAQSRLLGPSLILVQGPSEVGSVLREIVTDPERWRVIAENGKQRMGQPGAAERIALALQELGENLSDH